ncbi:ectonucleotide pyrophosphatase/phosphodiesterase [Myroides sp. DF42-4-2]|uniref:alkaline phosphatase family protein n=1 Tax=unclassified Myroides TaxID=2642485 RepID=UPI002578B3AB|nr:ectonucleotide pyrophosphatase/phosphodiesterase [Myroides sp. DF42-4-2]MDM1407014.1 alkaline phosphatase family protein [Myroides sp. DF42-4-2]
MKKIIITLSLSCAFGVMSFAQDIKHVILVSIDGFRPEFYQEEKWGTPNLKQMAKQGVSANGVRTIFPSVTYPSHTTLSTGTLPHKHGIYYNTTVGEQGQPGQWIYDSKDVQVATIWEKAKEKGLTTASVSWPITLHNAGIDYNLPEIWDFNKPMDRITPTKAFATPSGLFDEVLTNALGQIHYNQFNLSSLAMDENLGRSAAYLIKTYKPNLLTVHLPITDGAQHSQGREGDEVERAIAGADQAVGAIWEAVVQAGLAEQTLLLVTGDHGFVSTDFSLSPNIWLKEAGLFDRAFFFSTGGSAVLQVKDPKDKKIVEEVHQVIRQLPLRYQAMFEVISAQMIRERGGEPSAQLALSGKLGYAFSNQSSGEVLLPSKGGKHGYYPNFHEIYTGFVAYGKGLKSGLVVDHLHLEDIPVIISKVLQFDLPEAEGTYLPLFDVKK